MTCPAVCVSPVTQAAAAFAPDSLYTFKYCRPVEVKDSDVFLQDCNLQFRLTSGADCAVMKLPIMSKLINLHTGLMVLSSP